MATAARVFDFDSAIVRRPAASVVDGLRAGDHAGPSFEGVIAEHDAYIGALEAAGVAVEILPALEDFPDSIFVEDPAFVIPEGAILLRPGAQSRMGEAAELESVLQWRFDRVLTLDKGFADGGDIMITPRDILIGLSARTDREGAEAFAAQLDKLGRRARIVQTPAGTLHFKTASSLIDEETVIATPALAESGAFEGMKLLITPEGEEAGANLLRVNDTVLVGAGYPRTIAMIAAHGLNVVPLPVSEIGKIDAGLSCMSLRWKNVA